MDIRRLVCVLNMHHNRERFTRMDDWKRGRTSKAKGQNEFDTTIGDNLILKNKSITFHLQFGKYDPPVLHYQVFHNGDILNARFPARTGHDHLSARTGPIRGQRAVTFPAVTEF